MENLLKNEYTSSPNISSRAKGPPRPTANHSTPYAWRNKPSLAHLSYAFHIIDLLKSFWVPLNFEFQFQNIFSKTIFYNFSFLTTLFHIPLHFSPHYWWFQIETTNPCPRDTSQILHILIFNSTIFTYYIFFPFNFEFKISILWI